MSAGTSLRAQAFINAFSLEVSAKAMPALRAEAARIPPGTIISIPYLGARCAGLASSRCRISLPAASHRALRLSVSWAAPPAKPGWSAAC